MPETVRELVAYSIIGVVILGSITAYLATRKRRRQNALRRRGIKHYN